MSSRSMKERSTDMGRRKVYPPNTTMSLNKRFVKHIHDLKNGFEREGMVGKRDFRGFSIYNYEDSFL